MNSQPWYRTTPRWGQTNQVEIDPARYDDARGWSHWRRTKLQGDIAKSAGVVAYDRSSFPTQNRSIALGDRDLFGDIVRSARAEGLKVIARMDSNKLRRAFSTSIRS